MLASEMGVFLDTRTLEQIGAQFEALGPWTGAAMEARQASASAALVPAGEGDVILATWPLLLDAGRLQDGEPFLAGTAKATVAKLGPALATSLDVASGDLVTVTGPAGSVTVPADVTDDLVDAVVWLPTNSAGCAVRSTLGADNGTRVTVTKGGASL
jgi:NADH-quinone oxidoreductase subunit G